MGGGAHFDHESAASLCGSHLSLALLFAVFFWFVLLFDVAFLLSSTPPMNHPSVSGSQQAQRTASITNRARSELPYFGEGRVTWLGPFHSLFNIPVPEHLNGDRPGDAGFDPLNLFNIEKTWLGFSWKDWVASAEVLHGRYSRVCACLLLMMMMMIY